MGTDYSKFSDAQKRQINSKLVKQSRKPIKKAPKASKYANKRVEYDNRMFDSIRESERYKVLKLLEKGGIIKNLMCQVTIPVSYPRSGDKITTISYKADFVYLEDGKLIVEDSKGARTDTFKRKAKWFKDMYNFDIRET